MRAGSGAARQGPVSIQHRPSAMSVCEREKKHPDQNSYSLKCNYRILH